MSPCVIWASRPISYNGSLLSGVIAASMLAQCPYAAHRLDGGEMSWVHPTSAV